jgi:hypothetical protein
MKATVIGKFSAAKQATRAVDKLLKSCVSDDRVSTVVLTPSAQRPAHAAASNCANSSRSRSDYAVAAQHASARGDILDQIGDEERRGSDRPRGILVAVETPDSVSRALAVRVLCEHGALVVERDASRWPDTTWPDSDPESLSLFDKLDIEKTQGPGFGPIEIERPSSVNTGRRAGFGV